MRGEGLKRLLARQQRFVRQQRSGKIEQVNEAMLRSLKALTVFYVSMELTTREERALWSDVFDAIHKAEEAKKS